MSNRGKWIQEIDEGKKWMILEYVSKENLRKILGERKEGERILLTDMIFEDMDLTGYTLANIDFQRSRFQNTILDHVDFENSSIKDTLLDGCSMKGSNFQDADMSRASMRYCDMQGVNIKGADLFAAVLEYAVLTDIIADEHTRWFRMHCPVSGPILGYKKCVNDRLVQLLIPSDARRTSATLPSCRCDKAKVLTIKSFDDSEEFEEAWSLVDENFTYRKGEWVKVKDFNEDRWMDSATGIHFWLTKKEAIGY